MDLKTYLKTVAKRGTATALASDIGVAPHHISDYASGRRVVSIENAAKISKFTDGQVTVKELRPDVDWTTIGVGLAISFR